MCGNLDATLKGGATKGYPRAASTAANRARKRVGSFRPGRASTPLATSTLGRDLLSRVLYGGRVSLALWLGVELVTAALGVAIGLLAGYYGGWRDSLLMPLKPRLWSGYWMKR